MTAIRVVRSTSPAPPSPGDGDPVVDLSDAGSAPRGILHGTAVFGRVGLAARGHLGAVDLDAEPLGVERGCTRESARDLRAHGWDYDAWLDRDAVRDTVDAPHPLDVALGGGPLVVPIDLADHRDPAVLHFQLDTVLGHRCVRLQSPDRTLRDLVVRQSVLGQPDGDLLDHGADALHSQGS